MTNTALLKPSFAGLRANRNITLLLQDEMASGKLLKSTWAFSYIISARLQDQQKLHSRRSSPDGDVNQEGITIRREAETQLANDIVKRVQSAIEKQEAEERKQNKNSKVKVLSLIRWLIQLTNIAMVRIPMGKTLPRI